MTHGTHETLWCEADLHFWKYYKDCSHYFRQHRPDHQPYDKIPVHYQISSAENMEVPSITIHSPDWSESSTYHEPYGFNKPFSIGFNPKGHNWYGVARIDIQFLPTDVPFIYSGKIYTGGLSSFTCKLTRLKSTHQATRIVPRNAILTPLPDHPGVTRAEWTTFRHCRHDWIGRTQHHTSYLARSTYHWIMAPSPEQAIASLVLHRMNIKVAA
jgi:hypothetical protein